MRPFKRISSIASAFGVSSGVVVARSASKWLENQDIDEVLILAISIAIVAILTQVTRIFVRSLVENTKLGRRLILGRQYIEGVWIDLVQEGGEPKAVGLTRINIIEGELKISGDDYDIDGLHTGHYVCDFHYVDWPRIRYVYSYQYSDDDNIIKQGLGEFLFDDTGISPIRYSGHFFDIQGGKRFRFEGWKLKDRKKLKELRTPKGRIDLVKDWYAEKLNSHSLPE